MSSHDRRLNLDPWKPGQPGNPCGSSVGRRRAMRLRDAINTLLESDIPGALYERIAREIRETLHTDITFDEVIAFRLVMVGPTDRDPRLVMQAAAEIYQASKAKSPFGEAVQKTGPPVLAASEGRRRAVAEQLGIQLAAEGEIAPPKRDAKR